MKKKTNKQMLAERKKIIAELRAESRQKQLDELATKQYSDSVGESTFEFIWIGGENDPDDIPSFMPEELSESVPENDE